MSYTWIIITLQLIIVDEICAIVPEGVTSVCGATANATLGQNASITCKFGTDISKLRSDVFVFHYRQDPERVLECLWVNGKPKVTTQPGYEFNGNITTSLVLEIHKVTQEHEGSYACHVSKSSQNASTPCRLLIVNAMRNTTVTIVTFSKNINAANPEDEKQYYVFFVLIVLVAVVVALPFFTISTCKTLIRQFYKLHSASNVPSTQQQLAHVPNRICANDVEVGSVLTPLCHRVDIHIKNTNS